MSEKQSVWDKVKKGNVSFVSIDSTGKWKILTFSQLKVKHCTICGKFLDQQKEKIHGVNVKPRFHNECNRKRALVLAKYLTSVELR
jgi:hypothetical protein